MSEFVDFWDSGRGIGPRRKSSTRSDGEGWSGAAQAHEPRHKGFARINVTPTTVWYTQALKVGPNAIGNWCTWHGQFEHVDLAKGHAIARYAVCCCQTARILRCWFGGCLQLRLNLYTKESLSLNLCASKKENYRLVSTFRMLPKSVTKGYKKHHKTVNVLGNCSSN